MITIVADRLPGEPEILEPIRHEDLCIYSLDEELIRRWPAPAGGWSLEQIERRCSVIDTRAGVDAYLGEGWIGSSEV